MDLIKDFDRAIKIMKKDAEGNLELLKEIESLEERRPALVEATETKNTRASMDILKDAFRVEHLVHEKIRKDREVEKQSEDTEEVSEDDEFAIKEPELTKEQEKEVEELEKQEDIKVQKDEPITKKVKKKSKRSKKTETEKSLEAVQAELDKITSEFKHPEEEQQEEITTSKQKREMTPEEETALQEKNKKKLDELETEFKGITQECESIKSNWENLDDIKGNYSELAEQMKEVKRDVERIVKERKRIHIRVKELKEKINEVHTKKNKEFGMTKDAYKYFWNELLMVSVKLSEIEELFEKNERVTEMDLLELETGVKSLEKKLSTVDWVAKKRLKSKKRKKR
ncbi:hypothetical protein K8R43_05265 [archaeon]|nr:hypothetical protein [archaeon]